jgi:transcriptional regulator with XRE-family HTH domain
MTQDEIKKRLHSLRYGGKWSLRALAEQTGLSTRTILAAMTTHVSVESQARLSATLPMIARVAPSKNPPKKKPGKFKRFLIRYYNLSRWLDIIEREANVTVRFTRKKEGGMSRNRAGFICAQYDFQMKRHLLDLFGEKLRQRKVVMGDCYSAEKWIERVHKALPGERPALFEKLMQRGALVNGKGRARS